MNNNRFKCRIWDKEAEAYINENEEESSIFFGWNGGIAFKSFSHFSYFPEEEMQRKMPNLVREQCTALTDKNGKLMYEGDLVQIFTGIPFSICFGGYYYEGVDKGDKEAGYGFYFKSQDGERKYAANQFSEDVEIVGTIHDKEK